MRTAFTTLAVLLALAAPASCAGGPARPTLDLADGKLPLWQLRALDRRVWILTLEGTWKSPPPAGAAYSVVLTFPDGGRVSHRVLEDTLFRAGEVRCLIQEYQLIRHGVARSGTFTVAVSERRTPSAPEEVISNSISVAWPLSRPVVSKAPTSRATPPRPIDDFGPGVEPLPPPAPPASPPTQPKEPPPAKEPGETPGPGKPAPPAGGKPPAKPSQGDGPGLAT